MKRNKTAKADFEGRRPEVIPRYDLPEPFYKEEEKVDVIVPFVEMGCPPVFTGGNEMRTAWVVRHIEYPEQARIAGIQGRVVVKFKINKNGQVQNVKVVRGVHPLLDQEALCAVRSMPQWKPGTQRSKPVMVRFYLPMNFFIGIIQNDCGNR